MEEIVSANGRVAGIRQVIRGIRKGQIRCVLAATDADEPIKRELSALCRASGVELKFVLNKKELGISLGLQVDCAAVGILK